MAQRALRPCNAPGCHTLTRSSRCPLHAREAGRGTSKNRPGDPFYSSAAWRRLRKAALRRDKHLCQECLELGRTVLAEEVDHVVDRRDAPERELDLDNLRSLCTSCHSRKTARTQARRRRGQTGA